MVLPLSRWSCETSTDNPWHLVTPSGIFLSRTSPSSLNLLNATLHAYVRGIAPLNALWQISSPPSFRFLNPTGSWESPQGLPVKTTHYKWKNSFIKYGNVKKMVVLSLDQTPPPPPPPLPQMSGKGLQHPQKSLCRETQRIHLRAALGPKWCRTLDVELRSTITCL